MTRPVAIVGIAEILLGVCWTAASFAQPYPSKPIRIVVPYPPGFSVDLAGRLLGAIVAESMGQTAVVENRPGGATLIGMMDCAKAPPDGHVLCVTTADSLSFNPALFSDLPYNADTDFAPIMSLASTNGMLVANINAPFTSFKDLVGYAKANPGIVNWGTWGPASRPDMYLRWINHQLGLNIVAIPYKGAAQSYPSVSSGETHITYMGQGEAAPFLKAGKVKPIAILTDRRSRLMPGVPTLSEEGADPRLPGYIGLFTAGGAPIGIVDRLNVEFAKAIRTPKAQAFYIQFTWDAVENTPAEFTQFLRKDRENVANVFRSIGIKPTSIQK